MAQTLADQQYNARGGGYNTGLGNQGGSQFTMPGPSRFGRGGLGMRPIKPNSFRPNGKFSGHAGYVKVPGGWAWDPTKAYNYNVHKRTIDSPNDQRNNAIMDYQIKKWRAIRNGNILNFMKKHGSGPTFDSYNPNDAHNNAVMEYQLKKAKAFRNGNGLAFMNKYGSGPSVGSQSFTGLGNHAQYLR